MLRNSIHVLIAAALREERTALERRSSELAERRMPGIPDGDLLTGRLGGRGVALLRCGVGKVAAASSVAAASALGPRCIISVGSAAALHPGHRVGDVVIGTEVVQHDFAAVSATGQADPQGDKAFDPENFAPQAGAIRFVD